MRKYIIKHPLHPANLILDMTLAWANIVIDIVKRCGSNVKHYSD